MRNLRPRERPKACRGAAPKSTHGETPIRKSHVGASGFAKGGVTTGGSTTGGNGGSAVGSSTGSTTSETPKASAKIKFEHVDEGRWGGGGNSIDQVTAPAASEAHHQAHGRRGDRGEEVPRDLGADGVPKGLLPRAALRPGAALVLEAHGAWGR